LLSEAPFRSLTPVILS